MACPVMHQQPVLSDFTAWIGASKFPGGQTDRPCWTCAWFDGMSGEGTVALCAHEECSPVRSSPAHGCCCWEREPGSDDEPLTKALMTELWRSVAWPAPRLHTPAASSDR